MFLIIINYVVKILTIVIGIILVTGFFLPGKFAAEPMLKVIGVILIIWGIYRIILYRTQLRRYKRYEED